MKQLSRRCKYALRALYTLSRNNPAGPIAVAEIAERERIPRKFLEGILVQLRNSGLVESYMGKKGGYRLAKSPGDITIGAVIRIIDGPLAPLPCASESQFRACDECLGRGRCETRVIMRQVRDAIARVLDHTTLAQACKQSDASAELNFDI
jgi:Rrf2 family protein